MKKFKKFPSKLEAKTRELLFALPRSVHFKEVAKDTGLTENWIGMFLSGKIPNPGAGRVETLYEYLAKKPLDL
jgi:hypothetical protein